MAKSVELSHQAQWVATRVYATLYAAYVSKGMSLTDAIQRAVREAGAAAMAFDKHFPSEPTVDVTEASKTVPSDKVVKGWPNGAPPMVPQVGQEGATT